MIRKPDDPDWRDVMRQDEKRVIILFLVFGVTVILGLLAALFM